MLRNIGDASKRVEIDFSNVWPIAYAALHFAREGCYAGKPASRPSTQTLSSEPLVETLVLSINPVLQGMTPLRIASSGGAAAVIAMQ
jgi:hypothetical protein